MTGIPTVTDENPGDENMLTRYLDPSADKPSARMYANLSSDPVLAEVIRRKQPSYREMLMVVSAIVASLDDRIGELESERRGWDRATHLLNVPLFAGNPGAT